jgi:hypothetical protein
MAGVYVWGSERIPVGTWVCWSHGPVDPEWPWIVPACPHCGRIAQLAVRKRKGGIGYREPVPATCAGAGHHDFSPDGACMVSWGGTPPGRVWTCAVCGAVQHWPRPRGD